MDSKSSLQNNQKLSILTGVFGSKYSQKTINDQSVLSDYNYILSLNNHNKECRKIILLNHPELKELRINSKQEWDYIYKNNIINECIENVIINSKKNISKSILKINFVNPISENKAAKYSDIMTYIMNNISPDIYVTQLLNFLSKRKDIMNDFKLYLTKILLDLNDTTQENKKILENKEKEENKYIIGTNKFFNIVEIKLNKIKDSYLKINSNEKEKKPEKIENDIEINFESNDNSLKSIFTYYKSSPDLENMYMKNEKFEIQSKEEYYKGIESFQQELSKSFIKVK